MPDKKDDLIISEYNNLRSEIQHTQSHRIQILGFTIAAIAAIVGASIKDVADSQEGSFNILSYFLIVVGFLIVIGACYFTLHLSKHLERVGYYIYVRIEKKLNYSGWETFWNQPRNDKNKETAPKGLTIRLGYYYLFISILLYILVIPCSIYKYFWPFVLLTIIFGVTAHFSSSLIRHKRNFRVFEEQFKQDAVSQ